MSETGEAEKSSVCLFIKKAKRIFTKIGFVFGGKRHKIYPYLR